MHLAESTGGELVKEVMNDAAGAESAHAGELLRLLKGPAPFEEKHCAGGGEEVEEEIRKLKA